jgi:hypothetical protein
MLSVATGARQLMEPAGHGNPIRTTHQLHQEPLLLAWHVEGGFSRPIRPLQPSDHMPSEILRLMGLRPRLPGGRATYRGDR